MNSSVQQIFVECLLYQRQHVSAGDPTENKSDNVSAPMVLTFQWEKEIISRWVDENLS